MYPFLAKPLFYVFTFVFLQGKIPVVHVITPRFELTSQREKVSRLPTESPGRPAVEPIKVQAWGASKESHADSRDRQYSLLHYISNETLVGSFFSISFTSPARGPPEDAVYSPHYNS